MRPFRRGQVLVGAAVVIVLMGAIAVLATAGGGEAKGSSLSRGPNGWLAARKYLEARQARVRVLAEPLDRREDGGVLVVVFPWQQGFSLQSGDQIEDHLRRGGNVLLAFSGELSNPAEILVLERLGLPLAEKRTASFSPPGWRRFAREEWDLRPAAGVVGGRPVRVWAPRYAPEVPRLARALYLDPQGGPAIAVLHRDRGSLWILPADTFANARLAAPGNADLLETLLQQLGDRWTFDEYHHGLGAGLATAETETLGRTLDLVLLHLGLLYLAALLTLARRFGPAWSETPVVTGSAGSFLLGLGHLHHRLGHHREAARRLLERTRELDRNLVLPPDFEARAENAGPGELVALAREVARLRGRRPPAVEADVTARETAA
jgi:uncharacterized protein DUF4350